MIRPISVVLTGLLVTGFLSTSAAAVAPADEDRRPAAAPSEEYRRPAPAPADEYRRPAAAPAEDIPQTWL
ncbi:hypothetical protein ACWD6P_37000 [Streptomyces sp. NPDC002446]